MYRIYYGRFAIANMIILDGQIWHDNLLQLPLQQVQNKFCSKAPLHDMLRGTAFTEHYFFKK